MEIKLFCGVDNNCVNLYFPSKMSRKRALTMAEIIQILEESDSEDEEVANIFENGVPNVIYIPPSAVDAVSDEEMIDDEEMMQEIDPRMEIAGEVELEYETQVPENDFAAPELPEVSDLSEVELLSPQRESVPKETYRLLKHFGEPKWKRTSRFSFDRSGPDECAIEPIRKSVVEQLGLFILVSFIFTRVTNK